MFILWLRGSWFRYRDYINMKCLEEKYCTIYNEWFKSSTCYFSPPEMKWFYKAFSRIVYHLDQVSIKALFVRGGREMLKVIADIKLNVRIQRKMGKLSQVITLENQEFINLKQKINHIFTNFLNTCTEPLFIKFTT